MGEGGGGGNTKHKHKAKASTETKSQASTKIHPLTLKVGVNVANVVRGSLRGQLKQLDDGHEELRPHVRVRRQQLGRLGQQPRHADDAALAVHIARHLLHVLENPVCHHLKQALLNAVVARRTGEQDRDSFEGHSFSQALKSGHTFQSC